MNRQVYLWTGIAIMAVSTYLVRVVPMLVFRKKIKSRFIQSFLYYVPYAVLSCMTFPAVFYSTGSLAVSLLGTIAALILAYKGLSLSIVAIGAALVALIVSSLPL